MKYQIFEGFNHINQQPIFQVIGLDADNDYVGEWHNNKVDAEAELAKLESAELISHSYLFLSPSKQILLGVYNHETNSFHSAPIIES